MPLWLACSEVVPWRWLSRYCRWSRVTFGYFFRYRFVQISSTLVAALAYFKAKQLGVINRDAPKLPVAKL